MTKIKITENVPVEERHGIIKGRIFNVIDSPNKKVTTIEKKKIGKSPYDDDVEENVLVEKKVSELEHDGYWVQGNDKEVVKVWARECEVIEE